MNERRYEDLLREVSKQYPRYLDLLRQVLKDRSQTLVSNVLRSLAIAITTTTITSPVPPPPNTPLQAGVVSSWVPPALALWVFLGALAILAEKARRIRKRFEKVCGSQKC